MQDEHPAHAAASAEDPLPGAPELRPFPRSVDSVSEGGATVSTSAAGGPAMDPRRWRHVAFPAALILAGIGAVLRSAVLQVSSGGQAVVRELSVADHLLHAVALPSSPPGSVVLLVRDVTQARRVEELRRDFVANASHELKTPVASMVALSETLVTAANDPPALANFLGRLQQEATRLANLVQDLLALSRLEGGPLERQPVRLDKVVAGEADRLRPRAHELGVRVVLDPLGDVVVPGAESDLG